MVVFNHCENFKISLIMSFESYCNRTWGDRTTLLFWSWSWFCLHHHLVGGALLLITKMLHGGCAGLIMEVHHTWRWRHGIMAKEVLALMVWGGWNAGRQFKEEGGKWGRDWRVWKEKNRLGSSRMVQRGSRRIFFLERRREEVGGFFFGEKVSQP